MLLSPDYQQFSIADGRVEKYGKRMEQKLAAIPLPDLNGKFVLDLGCDHGFWSFLAADRGAKMVVGVDRNREVKGLGKTDLIALNTATAEEHGYKGRVFFRNLWLGAQYPDLGRADMIFLFSLYHHIYQMTGGDHEPIWFWLRRQIADDGVLLWENPTGMHDGVAQTSIGLEYRGNYNQNNIEAAASRYFKIEQIGGAGHVASRVVWRCTPKVLAPIKYTAIPRDGAGGATKAFQYADGRRIKEIQSLLGITPVSGSLNLGLDRTFNWDQRYFRTKIQDVVNRKAGIDSPWAPRWVRLYPVEIGGAVGYDAYALRFEGESYGKNFVELIADSRLRDGGFVNGEPVELCA